MHYKDEVGDKAIRVLQTANRLDSARIQELNTEQPNIKPGAMLAALILENNVDEDLVQTVLSRAYAIRRINLDENNIDLNALNLLPSKIIDEHMALPFAVEGRFLKIAIVDPTTASLSAQFKYLSNYNIEFQLLSLSQFNSLRASERVANALDPSKVKKEQRTIKQQNSIKGSRSMQRGKFSSDNEELVPMVCDHILTSALETNTSDIHIESFRDIARIRFRIDGRLQIRDEYSDYLFHNYLGVITRFKILADCDISEKRLPQDGAITFNTMMRILIFVLMFCRARMASEL